jgi:hypothetical protein
MKRLMMAVYVDNYADAVRLAEALKVLKVGQTVPTLDWDCDWEECDED